MTHPMPPAGPIAHIKPQYSVLQKGKTLFRIATRARKKSTMNAYGPSGRFDPHPPGPPKVHADHGIVYLAETLESAFAEVYFKKVIVGGYNGSGTIQDRVLQEIEITRDIPLLDFRGSGIVDAGMRQSLLDEYQDRTVTQAWARYILEDSYKQFPRVKGLVWPSAKNGQTIYAVYHMAKANLKLNRILNLHTPPMLTQVMSVAMRYRIIIEDL